MAAYQTKQFKKWNKKNKIPKDNLLNAIKSIDSGSGIVDLGGDLYKIRIAKNKGKSGGYRTLIIHKKDFRSLFILGFEKNELDNINDRELKAYKAYSKEFISYDDKIIAGMLKNGSLFNLEAL
ncbi:MAG: type II toxin-antitoxin system RelE/ParE family toxin [Fibromonadales bacterium]|nr:type II toxin-antitoxin system RelE/ParE family toxin [Fibromonadales bacterium]